MRDSLAEWISVKARNYRGAVRALRSSRPVTSSEIDIYIDRVDQLFRIAKQQSSEIALERSRRTRVGSELEKTIGRLKRSDRELRTAKRRLRRTERELDELRRLDSAVTAQQLLERVNRIEKFATAEIGNELDKRKRAEDKLKKALAEIEELQQNLKKQNSRYDRIVNEELGTVKALEERDRRRRAEKEAKNTKTELRHARRMLKALSKDHSKYGDQKHRLSHNGIPSKHDFVGMILQNVSFARDGEERLAHARNLKQVFDHLRQLNDSPHTVRGERVGSAEPWSEMRPNPTPTDRIYYRRGDGRGRYVVLIGDKNSQARDIEWMRRNN